MIFLCKVTPKEASSIVMFGRVWPTGEAHCRAHPSRRGRQ